MAGGWMGVGPRLGTLLGTLQPMPMCALRARRGILPVVTYFAWDDAKNANLRKERGIGFEDVVFHIERGDRLDVLEHPNTERYAGQRIFVVRRDEDEYVYPVPFVASERTLHTGVSTPS